MEPEWLHYLRTTRPELFEQFQKEQDWALKCEREYGYRAGVEAMRDAVAREWQPGIAYSAHTAQSFVDLCAARLLGESKEEGKE